MSSGSAGSEDGSSTEPVISLRKLTKSFSGVPVLDRVNLSVRAGSIHGLLGENGSGKSTLIKVLAGFHQPDHGSEFMVRGHRVTFPMKPSEPARLGLAFIHQDLGLVSSASVLENLFVGRFSTAAAWRIPWRREAERARAVLRRYGLGGTDPTLDVASLDGAQRAMLAVARAVSFLEDHRRLDARGSSSAHGLVIVDEVTSFLSVDDSQRVLRTLSQVAREGHGVLFVSHRLSEVFALCDELTVLRDGHVVASGKVATTTHDEIIERMLNTTTALVKVPSRTPTAGLGEAVVVVKEARSTVFELLSFEIRAGEVLGLTGLAGSGFEMVPYALFGAVVADGEVEVAGRRVRLSSMTPALAMRLGIGLVPADRLSQGAVADGTVAENATVLLARHLFRRGFLTSRVESARAMEMIDAFDVRPARTDLAIRYLSGGNQQKVIVAKWATRGGKVLLFHEPTRGVDVGAKQGILEAIRRLAAEGRAVLVATGDLGDIERVCRRVLVMRHGKLVATLDGDGVSEPRILSTLQGTELDRSACKAAGAVRSGSGAPRETEGG